MGFREMQDRGHGALQRVLRASPRGRRLVALWLVAGLGGSLAGCSLFGGAIFGGKSQVAVVVDDDLNSDFPVAVELVFVYDKALAQQLLEKEARQWFEDREQIFRDSPKKALESWRWEWVPGQVVATQTVSYRVGARAAVLFAGYSAPGEHRKRLKVGQSIHLHLARHGFTVEPLR